MNIEGIVRGQIAAVNPLVEASIQVSTGYTTAGDGSRSSTYTIVTGMAQVQALSYKDLMQISGLNIGGERRSIYFQGEFNAVVRPAQKGGDLITLTDGPNAGTWLIVLVKEQWPDWCAVIATLQNGA